MQYQTKGHKQSNQRSTSQRSTSTKCQKHKHMSNINERTICSIDQVPFKNKCKPIHHKNKHMKRIKHKENPRQGHTTSGHFKRLAHKTYIRKQRGLMDDQHNVSSLSETT